MADLASTVKFYFSLGSNHSEILECLARTNGVVLSLRSLRRILSTAHLFRIKNYSDILNVALFITEQVEKSGQLHGYRMMHLKCIQEGFVVSQNSVRLLLHIIDPEGMSLRKRN